jgi:hypothetical protein
MVHSATAYALTCEVWMHRRRKRSVLNERPMKPHDGLPRARGVYMTSTVDGSSHDKALLHFYNTSWLLDQGPLTSPGS